MFRMKIDSPRATLPLSRPLTETHTISATLRMLEARVSQQKWPSSSLLIHHTSSSGGDTCTALTHLRCLSHVIKVSILPLTPCSVLSLWLLLVRLRGILHLTLTQPRFNSLWPIKVTAHRPLNHLHGERSLLWQSAGSEISERCSVFLSFVAVFQI